MNFSKWYDKNYKKALILPVAVLAISIIYLLIFYAQTGDIINKDVTLTGGTSISISTDIPASSFRDEISETFQDFDIRSISDNAGNQIEVVITVKEARTEDLRSVLESYLEYELTPENGVSIETTSASLSEDFYKQLIVAILLAFFWMAAVVFLIFGKGKKIKTIVILLNILFGFFMGNLFLSLPPAISGIIFAAFAIFFISTYIRNSVPAFAVMLSAFADIVMTLALVDFIGMKISTAGIVAFLMIIGYSVDTDILLTTRILRKKESVNSALFSAFKTGTTMTLTSIIAITAALIIVFPFASVLNQIFIILLIGLGFDLFNTWLTNASIIKWYVEKNK